MAEPSKDTDQSMEDILQSIKRIIADEGEASPAMAGSDVLELTELLAEDTATPTVAEAPAARPMSIEEIMAAPLSSGAFEEEQVVAPAPAPVAAPVAAPAPVPQAAAPAKPAAPVAAAEPLMSDTTLSASLAALNALSAPSTAAPAAAAGSPQFRSGLTVEDLVVEALKPLLKEWLDGNLPSLVSALVEKEIPRLGAH